MGDPDPAAPELLIVTGMSGAGRSTAGHALEDLGWFVVDNLPPGLLPPLIELATASRGTVSRVAAVVDVRGRTFFADLQAALASVAASGHTPRIVFLEAADEVLIRRFEAVRRQHPLQGGGRITDGIAAERLVLDDLRSQADLVIDTSNLNVHELRAAVEDALAGLVVPAVRVAVVSFGYKYGLPTDSDLVLDCRFLPNPHWQPDLRPLTGLEPAVSSYVLDQPGARAVVDDYVHLVCALAPGFLREGKRFLTIGIGCTGGKHRSVAVAEELGRRLRDQDLATRVVHRDLGRE